MEGLYKRHNNCYPSYYTCITVSIILLGTINLRTLKEFRFYL